MEHKQIVVNWKEFEIPEILKRAGSIEIGTDFIITISGPRRAGKTYFCFQLMHELLEKGISRENLLYINFEDNKLLGATADDLDILLEHFTEISTFDKKQKIYIFMDEIQNVKEWDSWARKVHDMRKNIRLVLTGSSSKLLSKEISTKLRGRVINKEILPLSFREILLWDKISYNPKTIAYSKEKSIVRRKFAEFLPTGGYPAIILNKNIERDMILQNYYDSVIFKDIIERHRIEDVQKLKSLAQLLFQSVAREISYNKLSEKMKSIGFSIGKTTVIEYLSYFEDAYFFFQNLKYEYSVAKQLGATKKLYCIDNGILNSTSFKFSEDTGRLLENMVYIELRKRGEKVYLHKAKHECDFLLMRKNKIVAAIQVTKNLDEDNHEREVNGLLEALKAHKLSEGVILTEDQTKEFTIDNRRIIVKPAWLWLLEE